MPILFLDTETTDITPDARLVQLAYKDTTTGESTNEYFKPPVAISFGAMAVHHITEKMVADKPVFQGSPAHAKLIELFKDHLVIAHNATFDLKVLKNEGIETPQYIDTLRIAKHLIISEQYKLQYLRYSLNLGAESVPHDALGDIIMLEALFEYLSNVIQEKFQITGTDEILKKMLELTQTPVLIRTFGFGKYAGKTFEEIYQTDRGYLEWLNGSETKKPQTDQNEELVYTLQHWLKILV